jgi:O-antigen/teichoic acid export membrane protein
MVHVEFDPEQRERFKQQQRAELASRALWVILLESIVAGISILLFAYATDLNIWAILIPVLGALAVVSYITASKRLPK